MYMGVVGRKLFLGGICRKGDNVQFTVDIHSFFCVSTSNILSAITDKNVFFLVLSVIHLLFLCLKT